MSKGNTQGKFKDFVKYIYTLENNSFPDFYSELENLS